MATELNEANTSTGRKNAAIAILFAHAVKHIYHSGMASLIMPEIKMALSLNRAQFGSLTTVSAVSWWFFTMFAGYLGDRFSNKAGRIIALSIGLMGVAFFLVGVTPNYTIMLIVMFLLGIGPAIFHPPAVGELTRTYPERRGFVISLHGMAANIGEVLGPPFVAALLTFLVWTEVMAGSVIPALLVSCVVWVMVPSRNDSLVARISSLKEYRSSLLNLMRNRVLLLLIITISLKSVGEGGVGAFLTLYMREDLNYSFGKVALFISLGQIAGIVTLPVMGFLSDKIGRKPILVTGLVISMVSALLLTVAEPGYQLFLVVLSRGSLSISLHHIFMAAALDVAKGATQSTVVSLIYGASFLGTFSPYVAGLISDRYGIHSSFLYGGSIMIFPIMLLLLTNIKRSQTSKTND